MAYNGDRLADPQRFASVCGHTPSMACACISTLTTHTTTPDYSYYVGDPITRPQVVGIGSDEVLRAYERMSSLQPYDFAAPHPCQHCWCGEERFVNNKPHVSCCMCSTRRVK